MRKTPSRRPDFKKMYPNRAAFRRATDEKTLSSTSERMKSHSDSLQIGGLENFDFEQLRSDQNRSLKSFNLRRYSDELLKSPGTKIVPSAHGRIENILLTIPYSFNDVGQPTIDPRHERHYRTFIHHFSGNREFTILCHPDHDSQIQSWFDSPSGNDSLSFALSPNFVYTIWAQDAYVALAEESGGQILAEGVSFSREEDMTIADDVSLQSEISVLQSSLYFQGGNVLGGLQKTLVGRDYIHRNLNRFELETEQKVLDSFKQTFGTEIVPLGGSYSDFYNWYDAGVLSGYGYQPIFHLDMYVTPTGVVGPSGKEIVLFGRPSKAHEITGRWTEGSRPSDTFDFSKYDEFFDETETQLLEHFEVRHLPWQLTWGTTDRRFREEYYGLSFNNVVIENYQGDDGNPIRNVIMPTYSQDASTFGMDAGLRRDLEDAAESIWRDVGFNVFRMDGLEELANGLGSIHCITKALRRSPFTQSHGSNDLA